MSKYLKYTKKVKELMPDLADAEHTAHEIYGSEYGLRKAQEENTAETELQDQETPGFPAVNC